MSFKSTLADTLRMLQKPFRHPSGPMNAGETARPGGQARRFSVPPLPQWPLRLRLCLFFTLILIGAWLASAVVVWLESKEYKGYINDFYDTQQMFLANRLAAIDFSVIWPLPRRQAEINGGIGNTSRFNKDTLSFAVFGSDGRLVLTDDHKGGQDFVFEDDFAGFVNSPIPGSDALWRIYWMPSPDGNFVIAVGQDLDQREDIFLAMLMQQFRPWVLLVPLLLAGLFWILSRELKPLREVAEQLENRDPEDTNPLRPTRVPPEVRPMVTALNSLFSRFGKMLQRERAFISDAAHELRTPLTALRVQAEVAGFAVDDREALNHALEKLLCGIDGSTQLVEQLLMLSRLETMHATGPAELAAEKIDWLAMLNELALNHKSIAEQKGIDFTLVVAEEPRDFTGYPVPLALLLRNLLDNAVKYTPENGSIRITLNKRDLTVENSGPGVPDSFIPRLCERFSRPSGQTDPGSGLGLAIAKRAADINRLALSLNNRPGEQGGGFVARLTLP